MSRKVRQLLHQLVHGVARQNKRCHLVLGHGGIEMSGLNEYRHIIEEHAWLKILFNCISLRIYQGYMAIKDQEAGIGHRISHGERLACAENARASSLPNSREQLAA
jgi:hypothetical protein